MLNACPVLFAESHLRPNEGISAALGVPKWDTRFRLTFAHFRHSTEVGGQNARGTMVLSWLQLRGVVVLRASARDLLAGLEF